MTPCSIVPSPPCCSNVFRTFPKAASRAKKLPAVAAQGGLTRVRATLVDRHTLARLARGLGIIDEMRLGEAMLKDGGERPSIIANALEAVFGAVFVDAGFDAARRVVERVYMAELARVDPATLDKDPKTRLQEWLQARKFAVPDYVVTATTGEAHAQTMTVECRIPALAIVTAGSGTNRRAAEQIAAAEAYQRAAAAAGEHGD